jgi:hypothetical protein
MRAIAHVGDGSADGGLDPPRERGGLVSLALSGDADEPLGNRLAPVGKALRLGDVVGRDDELLHGGLNE